MRTPARTPRTPLLVEARQAAFLDAYSRVGSITPAAKTAGIVRETHYRWSRDPRYKNAFERAHQLALAAIIRKQRRRLKTAPPA